VLLVGPLALGAALRQAEHPEEEEERCRHEERFVPSTLVGHEHLGTVSAGRGKL
jgi:hypothetical protein